MSEPVHTPNRDQAIVARGLRKQFGMLEALRGIDLDIPRGQFVTLFGPNGAGKTTLLRLLSSLTRPSHGQAWVGGYDVAESDPRMRRQIGVISHASFLYDDLTAEENLLFYARLYGLDNPQARVVESLEEVDLAPRRHDKVRTFSRGMVQRMSIARAMIHDPSILFLDEPYTGLDQHASLLLEKHLRSLHDKKRTIIMTTHDFARGLALCDRAAILVKGKLAYFELRENVDVAGFEGLYVRTVEEAR